jgi:hypothetical protein
VDAHWLPQFFEAVVDVANAKDIVELGKQRRVIRMRGEARKAC